jgi:AcrR family transcriptional regulator
MPRLARKPEGQYHHGDLRNALLRAARALLEERGPSALSLREIARRIGISAPSAYHHFSGLEALAEGLAEQGMEELARLLTEPGGEGRDTLLASGEIYVGFARANPALYRLMFGEGFRAGSKSGRRVRDQRKRIAALVQERLRQRLPETEIPDAGLFLWSVAHGLALLAIDRQIEPRANVEEAVRAVLRFAGAGVSAAARGGR